MSAKHTPGPWHPPHFTRPDISCNCGYIFSEHQHYMGCVATVEPDNGLPIGGGGNDGAPLEEATANAHLLAAAPDLRDFAEAVLLFHSGGVWNETKRDRWSDLTGGREATTKDLCDFGRHVLAKAEGREP